MMHRIGLFIAILALGLGPAPKLQAVETVRVVHNTPDLFGDGVLDHVAITEEGEITLAPAYGLLGAVEEPIIWDAAVDARGRIFLGTGSDGRVLRLDPKAKTPVVVADFNELQVLAIAIGPQQDLFAATSPDGQIYRIKEGEPPTPWVKLEATYIWDLAWTPDGTLLAATGLPGSVQRIVAKGKSEPFLETGESHILSLALDGSKWLYAGSADNGYVYRCSLENARPPFVVLDAPGDEVRKLLVLPDHAIVALTLGPTEEGAEEDKLLSGLLGIAAGEDPENLPTRKTIIYRVKENEAPRELLRANDLTAHSLGFFRGQLLTGLGDEAKIVAIDPETAKLSFIADVAGKQVTAFVSSPDGRLLFTASHPGAVYAMEDRWSAQGIFSSEVIDTNLFGHWGQLDVRQLEPAGGSVLAETRSGNTDRPNQTWSPWRKLNRGIQSPPARYLQYRLTLKEKKGVAPVVRQVTTFYLPVNRPPRMTSIDLLDPGVRLDAKEEFSDGPLPRGINQPRKAPESLQLKEKVAASTQSARWKAEDPDEDALVFTVSLREASAPNWRILAERRSQPYINIGSTSLYDGWYQLKIEVSDAPSNLPEQAQTDALISPLFPVDHTPPTIHKEKARVRKNQATLRLIARDDTTFLRSASYDIDGGRLIPVFPEDQVFDELEEGLSFTTESLSQGEHIIVVTVMDGVENVATTKTTVRIP